MGYYYKKKKHYNKKKYYKKRNYYKNDYYDIEEVIAFFLVLFAFSVIGFIKKNFITILIFLIGLLILFVLIVLIKKHMKNKKIKNETLFYDLDLYKNIIELNNKYNFKPLDIFYDSYWVYYKNAFTTCNVDDFLFMTIYSRYDELKNYKLKYDSLKKNYEQYLTEYEGLKKHINLLEAKKLRIKKSEYEKKQLKIFNDNKITLDINFTIIIYVNYKNSSDNTKEKKFKKYTEENFPEIMDEYLSLKRNNQLFEIEKRIERAKMNPSLRYDILKRDNFKCQICGRTQEDGVVLHVDHIIPVSKGGKTEINNLQTLCDKCNIGKSDKI